MKKSPLIVRVGTQIYAVSNATNGTGITIEEGIGQADLLLTEVLKPGRKVAEADVDLVLGVAANLWAVAATGNSRLTGENAVSTAVTVVAAYAR
jgi:hypothetical protein